MASGEQKTETSSNAVPTDDAFLKAEGMLSRVKLAAEIFEVACACKMFSCV